MLAIWLILTLALALFLCWRLLSGRTFGHGSLLGTGVVLYCCAPFIAYGADLYEDGPGAEQWEAAFQRLYEQSPMVLALMLLIATAYAAGATISRLVRPLKFFDQQLSGEVGTTSLILLSFAWLYFIFQARELLFSGYLLGYRPDLMGPLANVNLCTSLIYLNFAQQPNSSRRLRIGYLTLLAVNSAALLSMGGRLYVMSALIGIMLLRINSPTGRQPKARMAAALVVISLVLMLAIVGIWRVGEGDSGLTLTHILFAEPVLTSISLGSLTDCPLVDLLNSPDNYLSSIINFIPSALLPDKEDLLIDLDPTGNCLASPFGATHIGVALLVNFGVAGAALVAALFAILMQLLGQRPGNWLYTYLCSLLPFMLFRDGFLIFNKAFFSTGIILAALLVFVDHMRRRLSI